MRAYPFWLVWKIWCNQLQMFIKFYTNLHFLVFQVVLTAVSSRYTLYTIYFLQSLVLLTITYVHVLSKVVAPPPAALSLTHTNRLNWPGFSNPLNRKFQQMNRKSLFVLNPTVAGRRQCVWKPRPSLAGWLAGWLSGPRALRTRAQLRHDNRSFPWQPAVQTINCTQNAQFTCCDQYLYSAIFRLLSAIYSAEPSDRRTFRFCSPRSPPGAGWRHVLLLQTAVLFLFLSITLLSIQPLLFPTQHPLFSTLRLEKNVMGKRKNNHVVYFNFTQEWSESNCVDRDILSYGSRRDYNAEGKMIFYKRYNSGILWHEKWEIQRPFVRVLKEKQKEVGGWASLIGSGCASLPKRGNL